MKKFLYCLIGVCCTAIVAMKMPLFFIVGSSAGFFSVLSACGPLAGYFGGFFGVGTYIVIRLLWQLLYSSSVSPLSLCVHVLPGWCATAFWVMPPLIGSVVLPLSAISLFVLHPTGMHAFVYAFLWFIPVIIYFLQYWNVSWSRIFFAQALCATFVAHAIGSVIWLYSMPPMTAESWLLLTPIAFAERLFFASSMSMMRYVIICSYKWIMKIRPTYTFYTQVVR